MKKPEYFKAWITGWDWGIRIALFLILLSALVQFGMFALTQNYMVAYMGAQPEDISYSLLLTNAGIISILPVQFRFLRYFETRSYLLVNIILAIILNLLCLYCDNIFFFFILRFLQGILVANTAACILIVIFSRISKEKSLAVGSAVFYGAILSNTVIIGMVAAFVVTTWDWKATYYFLILFQLFILLIILLIFKPVNGIKRYPLYQIDWAGFIIFSFAASTFGYLMIYGSKYYWFSDQRIQLAGFISITGTVLFLYRQLTVKRPLIQLAVFRSTNMVIGLCLLGIYYGSKDTINLIYNYAGSTLKWSTAQVMALGCCNVAGIVLFMIISTQIMVRNRNSIRALLCTGFSLMVFYNLWMYFMMTPDLAFTDLIFPVFLQGASSGLLFLPIVIFILSSAPPNTGTSGLVVAAYARFIAALNSFAGFYNLQLYFNQYFKEGFMGYLTGETQQTVTRIATYRQMYASKGFTSEQASALAMKAIGQNLSLQTQLLTNRAVFMTLAIILAIVAFLVLTVPSISKTYLHWNKRMFTPPRG
ncbi:MFS transporter [Pontibacter silvestris]|uniref:MFS transporter n=1 Tax=Pontibacter silvestris TaxID=2305183 RepID=A0ABW4WYF7_9BACT|nr:MFS transporter [Pontibacter silvestris]MCC9138470.1 MFS transporter [Pontibacter silvestris]